MHMAESHTYLLSPAYGEITVQHIREIGQELRKKRKEPFNTYIYLKIPGYVLFHYILDRPAQQLRSVVTFSPQHLQAKRCEAG